MEYQFSPKVGKAKNNNDKNTFKKGSQATFWEKSMALASGKKIQASGIHPCFDPTNLKGRPLERTLGPPVERLEQVGTNFFL